MKKIGVIGFGNLGKAFVQGILAQKLCGREDILICAKSDETLALARERYGVFATSDVGRVVQESGYLVLSVKKNVFFDLAPKIHQANPENKTVVSFLPGLSIAQIREMLGADIEIVRVMPTVAISEANGLLGYTPTDDRALVALLHALGFAFETKESEIEKVTAYAACGLGFAAYLIEAYIRAGVALGFDPQTSKKIAEANFAGALKRSDYKATMREVATKGGLTEHGLAYMTQSGVEKNISAAVASVYQRITGVSESENGARQ